jgi:hypothetical protein
MVNRVIVQEPHPGDGGEAAPDPLHGREPRGSELAPHLHFAVNVPRALAHGHALGVIHSDLKPSNVFLERDGGVKVLDFGLAHGFGWRGPIPAGTPAYRAPEQQRGDSGDARSDVFSAGAMLYEMLSGARPFPVREGRTGACDGPPPPLHVLGVPRALGDLVARSLSPDRARRPRDGIALLDRLLVVERALQTVPLLGEPAEEARARVGPLQLGRRRLVVAQPFTRLCAARALAGAGALADAQAELAAGRALAAGIGSPWADYVSGIYEALLALARGEEGAALEPLGRALALGRRHGLVNSLWCSREETADLCALAIERGVEVEAARELARRRGCSPPPRALDLEAWPWELEVRVLKGFDLRRGGEPVPVAALPRGARGLLTFSECPSDVLLCVRG